MLQTFNFRVEMPCGGCAGHVRQLLQAQLEKGSVVSFTVDPVEKLVRITTHLNLEEVQGELKKCGKPVTFLSSVNASIFNPGVFKFPKPPLKQGNLAKRPSTQPQAVANDSSSLATYTAPSPHPLPSNAAENWNAVHQPHKGGQVQGQRLGPVQQGSPIPFQQVSPQPNNHRNTPNK